MTLDRFIKEVEDELTGGCSIPFKLKESEVKRIIRWSKKWFYKNYENAVQEGYYVIPYSVLKTDNFKSTRTVRLEECVQSVIGVESVNEGKIFSRMGDFNVMRAALMQGGTVLGGQSRLDMPFFIANQLYYDVLRGVMTTKVTYNFNFNTNDLSLLGELKAADLVLTVLYTIPDEALFEDEIFYRYVTASCKIQLGRIISIVKMPLIGGAEIDYDQYKSDGTEEIDKIKEEIKSDEGADYFFMQ